MSAASNCVFCLDLQSSVVMVPCGHLCFCDPCALCLSAETTRRKKRLRCPICRQDSTAMVHVIFT